MHSQQTMRKDIKYKKVVSWCAPLCKKRGQNKPLGLSLGDGNYFVCPQFLEFIAFYCTKHRLL